MFIKQCLIIKQYGSTCTLKLNGHTLKNNYACFVLNPQEKHSWLSVNITVFKKLKKERVHIGWSRLTWKGLFSLINMRTSGIR